MSFGERIEAGFGSIIGSRSDPVGEAEEQRRSEELHRARRLCPEIAVDDLLDVEATPFVTDGEVLLEAMPPMSDPQMHRVRYFSLVGGMVTYWRIPADETTLAAWQRRRDDAVRESERAAREREAELEATPFVPVTLELVEGRPMPTLRAAGELARRFGTLDVVEGRLQIRYRGIDPHALQMFRDAVRVLYAAEELVVDCLEQGVELPECQITPAGAVIVIDAGELVAEDAPPGRRSRPRARSGTAAGVLAP